MYNLTPAVWQGQMVGQRDERVDKGERGYHPYHFVIDRLYRGRQREREMERCCNGANYSSG